MNIPQDNVFFCQNPVENCIFLRLDVNRDKSDVMTSFGMIDWSDVCRVFRQKCSSLLSKLLINHFHHGYGKRFRGIPASQKGN
jgi:hypothetical protein